MFRTFTILAAVVALAVLAAPASASSGSTYSGFSIDVGTSEAAKRVTDGTSNTLQFVTATPQPGGTSGIIAILIG